jgi:hypothetical protein
MFLWRWALASTGSGKSNCGSAERYFRLLLVGYFEGIDSERGIAWRAADSLGLRQFLHIGLDEAWQ